MGEWLIGELFFFYLRGSWVFCDGFGSSAWTFSSSLKISESLYIFLPKPLSLVGIFCMRSCASSCLFVGPVEDILWVFMFSSKK